MCKHRQLKFRLLSLIAYVLIFSVFTIQAQEHTQGNSLKPVKMNLRFIINNKEFTAVLYDTPTTQDLISLLPLTLELKDYANTEMIAHLPRKLSLQSAPSGSDPKIGDISYYAPWGNLAIFYKDFSYASGLIPLGRIEDIDTFVKYADKSKVVRVEIGE